MTERTNGREELARRLNRIFISPADAPWSLVPEETLLRFADELLAPDYTDPKWGPRPGDGGPAMVLAERDGTIEVEVTRLDATTWDGLPFVGDPKDQP